MVNFKREIVPSARFKPGRLAGRKLVDSRLIAGYIQSIKAAQHPRKRKLQLELQSGSFSLSTAKTYLGRLLEKATQGEAVSIVRGRRRWILQAVPDIEPIPLRPRGYFADCYTREEIRRDNELSKYSVVRPPPDLE